MAQESNNPTPEQEVELARAALAAHDLDHALHHIGSALSSNPANHEWLAVLVDIANRSPDPLGLVNLDSGHADFVTAATRAYLLAVRDQHQEALALVAKVAEIRPDISYLQWASWWLQHGNVAQSLTYDFIAADLMSPLLKMVSGCPCPLSEDDSRHLNVEIAGYACGVFRQLHPEQAFLFFAGSIIGRRLGTLDDALALAHHAHELEPSWRTCIGIANVYRDQGRIDDAVAQFRQAQQFDADDVSAFLDAGDTLLDAERYAEAVDNYQECLAREADHPWAMASIHYAKFKLSGDAGERESLLTLRAAGNRRAGELGDEIDPPVAYVTYLPRVGDASANAVRSIFEQMYENPAEHHGSTVKIKETHVESPSVVAAFYLQMEMWGPHVDLEWEVDTIQQPDPRQPKTQTEFQLWVYDGVQPRPNIAKPDANVALAIHELAAEPFSLELWEPKARALAAKLGPAQVNSLLGTMVHPPRPPNSDWRVLVWVQRVQVAAALVIAYLDSGWEGSVRKRTLYSLLYGPVDWTVDAAIIALGCLARQDPTIRAEVEQAFAWLQGQVASEGFTCFEYPLVSTWLALDGHDPATLARLEEWQKRVLETSGGAQVLSSEIKPKAFNQDEEVAKAQVAQQQLAAGQGGEADPEVFPGQPVARLSDYVRMMKGMQSGDMMGAIGQFGLDMGSYAQVMQAWGAKLQADPTLNAKFGAMMQQ